MENKSRSFNIHLSGDLENAWKEEMIENVPVSSGQKLLLRACIKNTTLDHIMLEFQSIKDQKEILTRSPTSHQQQMDASR